MERYHFSPKYILRELICVWRVWLDLSEINVHELISKMKYSLIFEIGLFEN